MSEQIIAVDERANDTGSDWDEGSEYSTESLASSIYEYRYENGRRYHAFKDGKYAFPNDETEQDRLDIFHHIGLLMLDGALHIAPINDNPQRILDVGTGTGIWAIDVGERYPSAEVIGVDLSPIQPSWVPPNVQFQIDDAESPWTWPADSFDMIHIRHLGGAIKDWGRLFKDAFHVLKPGGWIDICEFDMNLYSDDNTLAEDSSLRKYYRLVGEAASITGRHFIYSAIPPLLEDTGFEQVREKLVKMPLGTWPANQKQKEIGAYFMLVADTGFEALGLAFFTRTLEMPVKEAEELIERCKREMRSKKVHTYVKQYFYCAQKPLE